MVKPRPATHHVPVVQTLTFTKDGANWADLDAAIKDMKAVPKPYIPNMLEDKFREKKELVDSDTIKDTRRWSDWYDYEASYDKRGSEHKKLGDGKRSEEWWASKGWTVTEILTQDPDYTYGNK